MPDYIYSVIRATHLAKHLTEAKMCVFFGWIVGTKVVRRYIHLSGRDVENALIALNEAELRYWRTLCLKHSGASAKELGRYMIAEWKPILFLGKGSKPNIAGDYFIHDMVESKPPDKTLNDWPKVP